MKLKKLLITSLLACSSLFALSSCNNNSTIQYGTKYIRSKDFFAENKNNDDFEYIIMYKNHNAIWHDDSDESDEYYWDFLNNSQLLFMKKNTTTAFQIYYSKSLLFYDSQFAFISENYKAK